MMKNEKQERPDCAICSWRSDCPFYRDGTFCSQWRGTPPDEKRKDPNPGGWEPEDEDW